MDLILKRERREPPRRSWFEARAERDRASHEEVVAPTTQAHSISGVWDRLYGNANLSIVMAGLDPATQPVSSSAMSGFVYIMASQRYGTIYTGVTTDLARRAWEHKTGVIAGFTKRYHVHDLVYYEVHDRIETAIQREHNLKHWPRRWKTALIDGMNPDWDDLYPTLI